MHKVWTSQMRCGRLRPAVTVCTWRLASSSCDTAAIDTFRTSVSNPGNHSDSQLGQFYRVPDNLKRSLFQHGGLPRSFDVQTKTFGEVCIMVRAPAVAIIEALQRLDYSRPAVRFVLYGKKGCGKSLTLAHVLHFAAESNYLIVHVPWAANWMRKCKEYANSTTKEGYVDLPLDAASWLIHFRTQNSAALLTADLTTSKDYVWSKRETTPKGAKLSDLIEHGINRIKYASDCIVAVADEIKLLSKAGKCKTLVAIDGFNAFYYPNTRVYTDTKVAVPPGKVRLTDAFLELTKSNWCNAAVVVTVDELAIPDHDHGLHYPVHLLGKAGFEHLDPFIPVATDVYNQKEFYSCIKYYRDRLWVQAHGDQHSQNQELSFLSAMNPYKLMQVCAPL